MSHPVLDWAEWVLGRFPATVRESGLACQALRPSSQELLVLVAPNVPVTARREQCRPGAVPARCAIGVVDQWLVADLAPVRGIEPLGTGAEMVEGARVVEKPSLRKLAGVRGWASPWLSAPPVGTVCSSSQRRRRMHQYIEPDSPYRRICRTSPAVGAAESVLPQRWLPCPIVLPLGTAAAR